MREQQKREAENKKKHVEKMEIREKLKKGEQPVFKKKCKCYTHYWNSETQKEVRKTSFIQIRVLIIK